MKKDDKIVTIDLSIPENRKMMAQAMMSPLKEILDKILPRDVCPKSKKSKKNK